MPLTITINRNSTAWQSRGTGCLPACIGAGPGSPRRGNPDRTTQF